MSEVFTTKKVNLTQLAQEMGGVSLSGTTDETGTLVTCHTESVTVEQLQAAIDAHVAVDEDANRETIEARVRQAMTELTQSVAACDAILAKANTQIGPADIKTLAREQRLQSLIMRAMIRRLMGDYTGTT